MQGWRRIRGKVAPATGIGVPKGGRAEVRPALFMAALVAARNNKALSEVYRRLVANGKKPLVAVTALMRKIVVIANAKLRDARSGTAGVQVS